MAYIGKKPESILNYDGNENPEFCHWQNCLIKMKGSQDVVLPYDSLNWVIPLVEEAYCDARKFYELKDKYMYLTVKTGYVEKGKPGNRPGWHLDCFGIEDALNYIWSDMNPTQFWVNDELIEISDDDEISMTQMSIIAEAFKRNIYNGRKHTLYRLEPDVLHQVDPEPKAGLRTFVKITVTSKWFSHPTNSRNYHPNIHYTEEERFGSEIPNFDTRQTP